MGYGGLNGSCLVKPLGSGFSDFSGAEKKKHMLHICCIYAEHLNSWDPSSLRDLGVVMSARNGSEYLRILGVKRN